MGEEEADIGGIILDISIYPYIHYHYHYKKINNGETGVTGPTKNICC